MIKEHPSDVNYVNESTKSLQETVLGEKEWLHFTPERVKKR